MSVELTENASKVIEMIEQMKIGEVMSVVDSLKEKYNISDAAPIAVAAPAAGGDDAAAQADEPSAVAVKLNGFDDKKKISVIKVVRSVTDLGLKEAKELVESAPVVLIKDQEKEAAEKLITQLKEAGADASIE